MNQALQIGPLSLPYSVLLTLVAIVLGGLVAQRLARAADVDDSLASTAVFTSS